jgi:predicted metal-dependent peptidase
MNAATETRREITPEIVTALLKRIVRVRNLLGWKHPFYWPLLAQCTYLVEPCGTACVSVCGKIRIDPFFAETISDDELAGVLAHEASHLIYGHADRRGNREPQRWNRAGDRAINACLREAGIALPDGCLYPQDQAHELWCAEDLYDVEPEGGGGDDGGEPGGEPGGEGDSEGGGGPGGEGGGGKPNPKVGQGCGPTPSEGDAPGVEGGDGAKDWGAHWREVRAQCAMNGIGTGSGKALTRLTNPPPTKVKWETVLRSAFNQAVMRHGADDTTFVRRSRRTGADGPVFPGTCAYKAQVAVVIDTSGSMGVDAVLAAAANAVAIGRATGCRVYLVAHTTRAYFAEWIQPGFQISKLEEVLSETGGTCCREAYDRVAGAGGKFDAIVHLTDGELHWPTPFKPANCRRLIVGLVGLSYRDWCPEGATVIEIEKPA